MDMTVWYLMGAALVFFMQAGFAMVETGFTRAKNAGNIIMKNLMDFCIGTVAFLLLGAGLLLGEDTLGGFIGLPNFNWISAFDSALAGDWDTAISVGSQFIFNLVFCATTATIVSGAMAERTKFSAYCVYSFVMSLVVYPVEAHWIWGGGWLAQLGFHDFAGSTAIHMVGGTAALIGAIFLGARVGKYERDEKGKVVKINAIQGHSLTLGALGCFILWFGWYGFNGAAAGNTLSLSQIFVNTTIAPAVASCSCMAYTWIKNKKPDVSMTLNASLAGLVAITAPCAVVPAWAAAIIGFVAGILVVVVIELLDQKLHIDDPVGAVGVHFANGIWGTIAVGLFADPNVVADAGYVIGEDFAGGGLFLTGDWTMLGVQCLGIVAVLAWTIVTMTLLFFILKKTMGIRVSAEEEVEGLDPTEHGLSSAYADFVPTIPSYTMDKQLAFDVSDIKPAELELMPAGESEFTKVTIITRQEKFVDLKTALAAIGVTGMTVSTVMGCGAQGGKIGQYRGLKTSMNLLPKVKVEVVVSTVDPKLVVAVAQKALADGNMGAGKIFVTGVENVMRVRTAEVGKDALSNEAE
ncbi:MAG: ammonium transporter [Christensenellaceae bacterium]